MEKLIQAVIRNKVSVIFITLACFILGLWSLTKLRLDAIPDLSDTQVIIQANFPGQPPMVIEDQVTYPLSTQMLSVPRSKSVRGYSFFGYSLIYILFDDGTDLYWARSRVLEYLNTVQGKLPSGVTLDLGPDATSIGWVFQYAIKDTTGKQTLADLRDIQDFVLRYELTSVKGVAETASLGGFERQFQIEVNPDLLYQYKVTLSALESALKAANKETGARLVEQAETEYMVLVKGYVQSVEDIKKIPIRINSEGGVLRLGDIAHVKEGPDLRRGLADLNGEGEVVGGIVVMRQGEDVVGTIERVKKRLKEVEKSLPEGVKIITVYDRSILIEEAVSNLKWKLLEELAVVSLVTFIFLLHFRSALVALITLPLGVLAAFSIMSLLGIPANIMSMGGIAIAIGVMVDAGVVMVENAHKHIERKKLQKGSLENKDYKEASVAAISEVAGSLFWSMIILIVSFLPVFSLPEQSGRLFIPLALTKTLAMSMAALLTVFLMPILVTYFVRGNIKDESSHPISRALIAAYEPVLRFFLDHKKFLLQITMVIFALGLIPVTGIPNPFSKEKLLKPIGNEFMPRLEEGDLLYMPTTIPGISIAKAKEILIQTDQLIKSVPEVEQVFGKIGRAETATDPAPLNMIETTIILKDKSLWRESMTMDKIIQELDEKVQLPGLTNGWTMPIKTRIDMLSTGIKTPLAVKIMGDDLGQLQRISEKLEGELSSIEGVASVFADRVQGGNYIIYEIDRDKAALYGLSVAAIQSVLSTALGGKNVTEIIKGPYRWSANIRYFRSYRESFEKLRNIYIPLPNGKGQIPISLVAKMRIEKGPALIKSENARKTSWLLIDTRLSDIGSLADKVRRKVDSLIATNRIYWPPGYSYIISGQYEQMKLASSRMQVLVPLVIVIVFLILFLHFKSAGHPLTVMASALLFAPIGGIWFMYVSGFNRSVASDVGFIALAGLAAETGVIMLVYLDHAIEEVKDRLTRENLREAIVEGAVKRVRPKLMTVVTTMAGLLPLFWGDEPGNTAMRRIAAPMVGGLITSTVVTLVLIPAIYEWRLSRKSKA